MKNFCLLKTVKFCQKNILLHLIIFIEIKTTEAEYAFQLKKPIIPLMMENNYTADGWLGFIVGSKLWIDFRQDNKLDVSLDNLIGEIQRQGFNTDRGLYC